MGFLAWLADLIEAIGPVWDGASFVAGPAFIFFAMSIFPFRFAKRHRLPILLAAVALDTVVLYLADYLINGTIVNAYTWGYLRVSLVSFVVIAAGALILYRGNRLLICLTVLLEYNIFSAVRFVFVGLLENARPDDHHFMAVRMAILPTVLVLAGVTLLVVQVQKNAVSGLGVKESWLWFAVAFLSMVMMGIKTEFARSWWQMIFNGVDLIIANLVIYSLIFLYSRQKFIATEQRKILSNMDGYKGYLDQMKELDAHISTVRHEVRNHVFYIDQLLRTEDYAALRAYVDRQKEDDMGSSRMVATGNMIVDSIVNAKFAYAQSLGIRTECAVRLPETVAVDDLSLCSLLGNLLSNAIEGSEGVEDARIELNICTHKDYLIITVRNAVGRNVIKENPRLLTTKKDAENHGIGLKVVEQIVDSYGGDLRIEMGDRSTFCVSAMIKNRAVDSQPGKN